LLPVRLGLGLFALRLVTVGACVTRRCATCDLRRELVIVEGRTLFVSEAGDVAVAAGTGLMLGALGALGVEA
jgi:hypothetical protein